MSLLIRSASLSLAVLLLIGCDENQLDTPDPQTQPTVNDRDYISPEAQLPRPEPASQPEYPVTPPADTPAASQPDTPAASQPEATDPATQSPAADPAISTSPGVGAGSGAEASASAESEPQDPPAPVTEEPAVEEVPVETPPSQN